jgi:L-ascorbate metabolism protein UlaG (beta-lactamase superfamily)
MNVTWIGGATVRIEMGPFRILTDPMFCEGSEAFVMYGDPSTGADKVTIARMTPLPAVELDDLNLLMVSHVHADHFDTSAVVRLPKDLETVAPPPNVEWLGRKGFRRVGGMDWGAVRTWHRDGQTLTIRAIPAHHAHDAAADHELGMVNGYVIEHGDTAERIYWTGDTIWFEAMAGLVRSMPHIDLLLPHLGGVGRGGPWGTISLDAVEGVRVVRLVQPGAVIPIHHTTFSHYAEPISAFVDRLRTSDYRGELVLLAEGERWVSPNDPSGHD